LWQGIDQQQLRRIVPACQQDGMSGSRLSIPRGNPEVCVTSLPYEPDKERAVELVRKRVPVNKGEEAEAVAEVAGNEFTGQNMRPGDVRWHG
jgi:hypothetical protein